MRVALDNSLGRRRRRWWNAKVSVWEWRNGWWAWRRRKWGRARRRRFINDLDLVINTKRLQRDRVGSIV